MSTYLYTLHAPRWGWQFFFFRRPWLLVLLAGMAIGCLSPQRSQAQLAATYAFAKSTTTFSPLASGSPSPTPTPMLLVDTGNTPALPLGFTFRFDGVDYTSVVATSDGYLSFNPNAASVGSDYDNDMLNIHEGNDPLIAGLWDDLSGLQPGAVASYVLTGTAPNRVFTFEWINWRWSYSATAASVSFQIKLHEGSNQIEMVYRPEAGATSNPSASIGLRSVGGTGVGSFLSVSDLTAAAVASTTISYNGIAAKPTAGLTFTFTPTPCSVPPAYATLPVSQSFETTWTDACAVRNAAGASWRTTPLVGDNSWRRDDDGAAAAWRSPAGYLPSPVASQGTHAAVFHSAYTSSGTKGSLDLYVNLSGSGTKTLSFDYVNVDQGNSVPDQLDVLLSTDGGQTFGSSLLTLTTSNTYQPHSLAIPSTSATSVIRFQGTGDYANTDIGLDNVQLVAATCAPPTSASVSSITSTSASVTFVNSGSALDYTVTYQRQGGPVQTVAPNPSGTPVALTSLTPMSVYTVSVVSNCSGSTTSAATPVLTFTTAPANDLCSSAQVIVPGTACTATNGTVGGATTSSADGKLDVWYSFAATSTEHHVVVAPAVGSSISNVTEIYVGSTCPGSSAVPLVHNSSSNDTYLTGLTPTQTYFVRVYHFYNNALTPADGAFTICVTKPFTPAPANDLCANAQALTPATPCAGTAGTVGGATADPTLDTNDDVWYTFVATSTQHNILVTPTAGASLVTQVYNSTCPNSSSPTLISNASSNNTFITGLTPTQTYRVRVFNFYTGSGFLSPAAGAFTICVDNPSNAPANDECAGAIALTPGTSCTSTSGTLFGSTQSTVTGNCGGTPDDDVWYKFIATSTNAGITVTTTGGLDLVLNLRSGLCGSTTSMRCANQGGSTVGATDSISVRNLVMGQTYFVRVYSYDAVSSTASNGTFSLCVVTPPICAPPTALTATSITNTTATLGWTAGAASVSYQLEYGPAGFTPGTGTVFNTGANSAFVSSLTAGTAYQFYVTQICGSGLSSVRVGPQAFTTTGLTTLTVSSPQTVSGTYDIVHVTPTGVATLGADLVVNQSMDVQAGGVLVSNCHFVTGAGTFALNSGAELRICDPAGILTTGNTGAIRVTGTRAFDTDASYTYNGTVAQSSGSGLPTTVRDLTVNNGSTLVLNNTGVSIRRVLRLTSGGLNTSSLPVRLLSSSAGTALIDNTGGVVNGTVLVDRYVSNALNAGMGYRHLSAPVASAPVSQLGSGGSPIVTNPAFNAASATVRPTITPYPTVFSYDDTQVPAGGSTAQAFDQGWQSPASNSALMGLGQGYTVQVVGGQTLTFSGAQNNALVTVSSLGYGSAGTQTGWHLLGNPYPSPLDWSTMTVGTATTDNLQNMSGAVYVFQSSGQYAGTYRTYQNGQGGDPIIASGQAFFVRTAGVGQSGTFRTSNTNRITTWSATGSTLYRGGNDPRPRLELSLSSPSSPTDATTIYTETGATPAVDARYDAYKLRNPGAANFYSLAGIDELTINGLPPLATADVVVPLGLSLMAPGPCVLALDEVANFPAATGVLLRDNLLGTLTDLRQQPTYAFTATAGNLASNTRFALVLRPSGILATRTGLQADQVSLYPNPAHTSATLLIPTVPNATSAAAVLLDALGRTVWQRTLPVTPSGISTELDLRALPTGVYMLRLQADTSAPVTKRLTVE